jgi:hypothetical protein
MSNVWKTFALLLAVTALVWLITMWRWQSGRVDPSGAELALGLGVLPLMLTGVLVAGLWSVKRLRQYAGAPVVLPANAGESTAMPAAASADNAERDASFTVLAASAHLRAGSTWSEALESIATGDCKPELDKHLTDDDGIALFTAPMPELATDNVAESIEKLVARLAAEDPAEWRGRTAAPAELIRTLALLQAAIASTQDAIETQWQHLRAPPAPRGTTTPAAPPCVSIHAAISSRWPHAWQQAAEAWVSELLAPVVARGLQAAGQSVAMTCTTSAAVQLHVHRVDSAEAFWLLLDQQWLQWQREQRAGVWWAMAADSFIGEHSARAWESAGELFSGRNPLGRVPGEGAAALLLATDSWPTADESNMPLARLHRASVMQREKSADAVGRTSSQTLALAVTDALRASGCEASQIQHLSCDIDHRASRTAELYEVANELLTHVAHDEHLLRLGQGCGELGVARLLAAAALAASQVHESNQPALLVGASPALERLAVVLTPMNASA